MNKITERNAKTNLITNIAFLVPVLSQVDNKKTKNSRRKRERARNAEVRCRLEIVSNMDEEKIVPMAQFLSQSWIFDCGG